MSPKDHLLIVIFMASILQEVVYKGVILQVLMVFLLAKIISFQKCNLTLAAIT